MIKKFNEFVNENWRDDFENYLEWNDLSLPVGISMALPHDQLIEDADLYVKNFIEENPKFSENEKELIEYARRYFTS